MEKIINLKHTYTSLVIAACLFATNVIAKTLVENAPLEQKKLTDKKQSLQAREASATKELTDATEPDTKINAEDDKKDKKNKVFKIVEPNNFQQVKFNEDFTSYTLLPSVDEDENLSEQSEAESIAVTEADEFYIKRPVQKKQNRFNIEVDFDNAEEEDERDCWTFSSSICNPQDGFHYAFSFVSSGGDDIYQASGESTDINTYASYRIQIASLFIESPGMATRRIHGLYAGKSWGINFYNTDNWRLDLYKERDTGAIRDLQGIKSRTKEKRAGIRLTGFWDSSQLQINMSPYSRSNQEDDGIAGSLSYTRYWQVRNWSFYGSLGVQYQPKQVVSYYEDAPVDFTERKSRLNQDLEIGFEYPLSKSWVLGGFFAYSESDSALPGAITYKDASDDSYSGARSGLLLSFVL
ncbi:hypothetical protein GCM10008107_19700 [Psychrosphaera saromensis]|uniref:Porin domain-containing protein n=1 Tax=Psychrosphaera saromensis TaxID=716813 RepID=A0A2S7UTR2_9GAMM|nr:MipA/OmpV family protein [Psychrosphaera saromensis]PQJ52671.1 hypothetical protein BTO11_02735 [Psychrosphaera saromensis]GHB70382.1 hypothetical protein GCM10008107_19700 [Psychrosphaera saromensis]GLQ13155.1 hypothetical protein GCM10007917_06100 [Psychrosphaera saromensis]